MDFNSFNDNGNWYPLATGKYLIPEKNVNVFIL